jgi:hypothetical protein
LEGGSQDRRKILTQILDVVFAGRKNFVEAKTMGIAICEIAKKALDISIYWWHDEND